MRTTLLILSDILETVVNKNSELIMDLLSPSRSRFTLR
jgi:hypothetical protein